MELIAGWTICLSLRWSVPLFREMPGGLLSGAAHFISKYSYGIYLSHMPLLWLCLFKFRGICTLQRWLLFAVLACAAPVALYHLLEHPLIRIGKRLARLTPVPAPRPVPV